MPGSVRESGTWAIDDKNLAALCEQLALLSGEIDQKDMQEDQLKSQQSAALAAGNYNMASEKELALQVGQGTGFVTKVRCFVTSHAWPAGIEFVLQMLGNHEIFLAVIFVF